MASPRQPEQLRPVVSVCILSAHRPRKLAACLASLQNQRNPPSFEVIILANGDEATAALARQMLDSAVVGTCSKTTLGRARNAMVDQARGELLLFLDDDVAVGPSTLRTLADLAAHHGDCDVFGGPNLTPRASSHFQIVQGAVLASLVASGPARRRYGRHPAGPGHERFLTLCNLAIRRRAIVPFLPEILGAEENAALRAMAKRGSAFLYDPQLAVFHHRRPTFWTFVRQMYTYGRGRGQLLRRSPGAMHASHIAPLLLLCYVAALPILLAASWRFSLPLALYGLVVGAGALKIGATLRDPSAIRTALALIPTVHFSYGVGVARGLWPRPANQLAASSIGDPRGSSPSSWVSGGDRST